MQAHPLIVETSRRTEPRWGSVHFRLRRTGWLLLHPWALPSALMETLRHARSERRWRHLRRLGMSIGRGVNLPDSLWIDTSHCHLISIGDHTGFGPGCVILAHDALVNEFLDATRVGRVLIHESCHFGARTVILPGVEIGPRTIVGAGSVVTRSLPPDSVASGNPARVVCSLEEYLDKHRRRLERAPVFPYETAAADSLGPIAREQMRRQLSATSGYVLGGRSAVLSGQSTQRLTR